MAPEVMLRSTITPKVDVYSFGIVVWEIVKKEAAFSHHSDYNKFSKAVIDGERPPLDGIHPEIAKFLAACWAKNPDERPDFLKICSQLDELMIVVAIENDANARMFWRFNFLGKLHVGWKDFNKKLLETLGQRALTPEDHELPVTPSDTQISKATANQRREFARRSFQNYRNIVTMYGEKELEKNDFYMVCTKILFTKSDDQVDLENFGHVIGLLGPFDGQLLARYYRMVESEWFHGNMSKTEAEDRLRNQPPGTYLVRFSANNPNNYVISKVSADKSLKHMLVLHKPGEGFIFNKKAFPTFEELLKDTDKSLNLKGPCSNSIFQVMKTPFNPYSETD